MRPLTRVPVFSNGTVTLRDYVIVDGKARGNALDIAPTVVVTGDQIEKARGVFAAEVGEHEIGSFGRCSNVT